MSDMFIEPDSLSHFFSLRRSEMFYIIRFINSQAEQEAPMANTFSQIYIQTVFAVSGRESLIKPAFKEELYKYMTGIIRNQKQKLIAINGMPDHVHILIGLRPAMALADLIQQIKVDSTHFINKRKLLHGRFNWQEGYGAFSYGHSQLDTIIRYIQNQEKHHVRQSFKSEYMSLLRKFDIGFEEKYVFEFIE
jgi:REP element-mobilizing transposase RayT